MAHDLQWLGGKTPYKSRSQVTRPPCFGVSVERHTEIFESAYVWAQQAIAALEAEGDPSIMAILAGPNAKAVR